jgi:hypothetical protein
MAFRELAFDSDSAQPDRLISALRYSRAHGIPKPHRAETPLAVTSPVFMVNRRDEPRVSMSRMAVISYSRHTPRRPVEANPPFFTLSLSI